MQQRSWYLKYPSAVAQPKTFDARSIRYAEFFKIQLTRSNLPNEDLGAVTQTSSPADGINIANGNNLAAVDLTRDSGAGEFAVGGGSRSGASFPSSTTVGVDLDGAEVLIAEVSAGPGGSILIRWGQGREELSLSSARDGAGGIAAKVEDELALVVGVLLWELECDERGDVGTAVLRGAGDETASGVEVDGARGRGILAGEVWED